MFKAIIKARAEASQIRELSAEECRAVSGGGNSSSRATYYAYKLERCYVVSYG